MFAQRVEKRLNVFALHSVQGWAAPLGVIITINQQGSNAFFKVQVAHTALYEAVFHFQALIQRQVLAGFKLCQG